MSLELTYELDEPQENAVSNPEHAVHFELVLRHSHKNTYYPGQHVEGHVSVNLPSAMWIRGIIVYFHGHANIYWTEKTRGSGNKCIDTVSFDAKEEYFDLKNELYEAGLIEAGSHKLPFKFHLSPPIPDSFEDNLCQIQYYIEARLKQDTRGESDITDRKDIVVVNPIDLNKLILPDVTLPVHTQKTLVLGCSCWKTPPIVAFLRLTRTGYSPGEVVHVQAALENNANTNVKDILITIYEERVYQTKYKVHNHRDVVNKVSLGPVKMLATTEWSDIPVLIPRQQIFNVSSSNIFSIKQYLEMEVIIKGSRKRLILKINLTFGSIPLSKLSLETPAHVRLSDSRAYHTRETVTDVQLKQRTEKLTETSGEHEGKRQRRKERNRKIYPENVIDSTEYRKTKS